MPNIDRGVYEPGDDVRVYDGSEDDEDVEGSRLPLLIVLALLVLAMFAGVVWLAYTQGVARGRSETPVLTAQNGPARIAPQNPGGAEEPYKGFKIYEQPAPADDDADTSTTPTAPAPVQAAPKQAAVVPPSLKPAVAAPALTPPAPKIAAAAPAPKPVVPPVSVPVPAPKMAAALPPPVAKPAPPVIKPSAPAVVQKTLPPVAPAPATGAPRSLTLPVKPAPSATAAAAGGAFVLQIGAYKSQAEADTAWKTYRAKHNALLAGAANDVQQADLGEKGTWYRLRVVGFPSRDVATAMCERLKADGGNCFLGR